MTMEIIRTNLCFKYIIYLTNCSS